MHDGLLEVLRPALLPYGCRFPANMLLRVLTRMHARVSCTQVLPTSSDDGLVEVERSALPPPMPAGRPLLQRLYMY